MDFETALQHLKEKFTSGNAIPVTANTITREEYEAVRDGIAELLEFKHAALIEKLEKLEQRK